MVNKFFLCCYLFILLCSHGFSQGLFSYNSSSIGVTANYAPKRMTQDGAGGYQYSSLGLNGKIPLFGNHSKASAKFYQVSMQGDWQYGTVTLGFLNTERRLSNANAGLGAVIFNGKKSILMINTAMGFAADQQVADKSNTRYRVSGSFIVNHMHSARTVYQYGAALTYAYGKPLLLPVLGIRTKLSSTWTFSTILPAEISFINKVSNKTGLSFSLRPSGNRFQFDNSGNFSTASSTVFWQLREFQLATALHYKLTKQISITGDMGFLVGGKMQFTEQDEPRNTLYTNTLKPGTQFRLSVRYRISGSSMRGNGIQDILNPLGN